MRSEQRDVVGSAMVGLATVGPDPNKRCPDCGKFMVRWHTGEVLTTYPGQYPWVWRCGCGHQEKGGVDRGVTDEDLFRMTWEAANRAKEDR